MPISPTSPNRRQFLRYLLGTGAWMASGAPAFSGTVAPTTGAFRMAFVTDIHLMKDGGLRSAEGLATCLDTLEKVTPRPEFVLVGGDMVHALRDLTISEAEARLSLFLKIWNDHTQLPVHWTFGNHDLVGTSNLLVSPLDPHYGKGLFRDRLGQLFYSFDWKGWHFVVLDDIDPQPDHTYIGRIMEEEFVFLRADLEAHRDNPTIICTHIPTLSGLPLALSLAHQSGVALKSPKSLVCTNSNELFANFPPHQVRAVFSGHLHHYERLENNGVLFINSGAVCGNYWKGPMLDCPEGFGVVDLGADGSVAFDYRTYSWKTS